MLSNSGFSLPVKEIWPLIIILALHSSPSYGAYSRDDWVSIDCGSDELFVDDNFNLWDSDDLYTDAGIDNLVRVDQPLKLLDTLRAFPNSNQQNCYKVPILQQKLRYLVRSGFLYGDYDSLSRPPTFDLRFDGRILSTIKIPSIADAINDEVAYTSEESGVINFCMAQKNGGGVPFISSLQAIPTDGSLYPKMPMGDNFRVVARINFGGDGDVGFSEAYSDDSYERLWMTGTTPPNCNNISTFSRCDSAENDPPSSVLGDAIESNDVTSPIILTVNFPQNTTQPQSAYFVFYFSETDRDNNRTMNILINGEKMSTFTTDPTSCTVITLYPVVVSGSSVNVKLVAAGSTGLPPLINGMEVFTKISTGVGSGAARVRSTLMSFVLMLSCLLSMRTLL